MIKRLVESASAAITAAAAANIIAEDGFLLFDDDFQKTSWVNARSFNLFIILFKIYFLLHSMKGLLIHVNFDSCF